MAPNPDDIRNIRNTILNGIGTSFSHMHEWRNWEDTGTCKKLKAFNVACKCPYGINYGGDVTWPYLQYEAMGPCMAYSKNRTTCLAHAVEPFYCSWKPFLIYGDVGTVPGTELQVDPNYEFGTCVVEMPDGIPKDRFSSIPAVSTATVVICYGYSWVPYVVAVFMVIRMFLNKIATTQIAYCVLIGLCPVVNEFGLKKLTQQRRPGESCAHNYGMPSSHAVVASAIMTFKMLLLVTKSNLNFEINEYYAKDSPRYTKGEGTSRWVDSRVDSRWTDGNVELGNRGTARAPEADSPLSPLSSFKKNQISYDGQSSSSSSGPNRNSSPQVVAGNLIANPITNRVEPQENGNENSSPAATTNQVFDSRGKSLVIADVQTSTTSRDGAHSSALVLESDDEDEMESRNTCGHRCCADFAYVGRILCRCFGRCQMIHQLTSATLVESAFWLIILAVVWLPVMSCRTVLRDHTANQVFVGMMVGFSLALIYWALIFRCLARELNHKLGCHAGKGWFRHDLAIPFPDFKSLFYDYYLPQLEALSTRIHSVALEEGGAELSAINHMLPQGPQNACPNREPTTSVGTIKALKNSTGNTLKSSQNADRSSYDGSSETTGRATKVYFEDELKSPDRTGSSRRTQDDLEAQRDRDPETDPEMPTEDEELLIGDSPRSQNSLRKKKLDKLCARVLRQLEFYREERLKDLALAERQDVLGGTVNEIKARRRKVCEVQRMIDQVEAVKL